MGGKKNRERKARNAERGWIRSSLGKSQQAGHGFHADPGGTRQTLIARLWESFRQDQK